MMTTRLAVLGSTGSIGTQTLDVVRRNPAAFQIIALAAGKNVELICAQAAEFQPRFVVVGDAVDTSSLAAKLPSGTQICVGREGLVEITRLPEVEVVMQAVLGFEGLYPVLSAIESGKDVALANKESLVAGGSLIRAALQKSKSRLIPVDSEHSSIYQCLLRRGETVKPRRIVLTASGGPFLHHSLEELEEVTPEMAVRHPRWQMGAKISVDSATLMNKGLEVIEAAVLFDLPAEKIDVLIHPESIVHGFVEYSEGTCLAALFLPDMRVPITYALESLARGRNDLCGESFSSGVSFLQLAEHGALHFSSPDYERFQGLKTCYDALRLGGKAPIVLNAANEVAVQCFLDKKLRFVDIPAVVKASIEALPEGEIYDIEDVIRADAWGREFASNYQKTHYRKN